MKKGADAVAHEDRRQQQVDFDWTGADASYSIAGCTAEAVNCLTNADDGGEACESLAVPP